MVQFDNQYRQIKIKIVYYGPALGGKTTCLQHIHRVTDPQRRTKLYSLSTASDRTLFFDLLSLDLGRIRGYRLAMQLYTVPGQVQYNATRRAVLSGADGVVFVADSQLDQRDPNLESLTNLGENLTANGLDVATIPLVLLYNKRDLSPLMSVGDMDAALNTRGVPTFATVATTGDGVMEAFAAVCECTLAAVADKLGVGTNPQAVERLQVQVRSALQPFMEGDPGAVAGDVEVIRPQVEAPGDGALAQDALVSEAVRANLAMTDLNARLDSLRRQLERRVEVMEAIADFGQVVSAEHDPSNVLQLLLDKALHHLQVQGVSVLEVPGSGQLRPAVIHGMEHDPLLRTSDEAGESLALGLVAERQARLLASDLEGAGESYRLAAVRTAGFESAVLVPLIVQDRILGLLACYADHRRRPLDEDDLQLASVFAATAAMGYANAMAWRRLEELNRGLEGQVRERTREVQESLEEVQRLATDLEAKNRVVEETYRELAELDRIKNELLTRISQELRTPVTSLLTAAKILHGNRDVPPEKSARMVSVIHGEAHKLTELIDTVFQASVLASTQEAPKQDLVPAGDLFKRAIAPLRDLAREREVRLQVLIPNSLEAVFCDPATMEPALRAIVKNAIEFNHKGGDVKVELRRVRKGPVPWLVLTVSDTGVGLPDTEVNHAFDTFWQGSNVMPGTRRGVGLGLAIAKRVVENHGGTVSLSSRVAEGTVVTVSLPQEGGPSDG